MIANTEAKTKTNDPILFKYFATYLSYDFLVHVIE